MAEVKVRITGDSTGFNSAMTRAQVTATAFANRMRTLTSGIASRFVGLFGTAAIGMMVRNTIQWADQLNDTSKRLGVNAEQLQKWEYAAVQTGSSIEKLTTLIEKLKKSQADAARGLSTAKIGLAAFGITDADDVETMLSKIANRVQSGSFSTGSLMDIGGRGATSLIPALQQWEDLADAAERAGVIIRQEQLNALEKIQDQFTFLSRFMMAQLAPAIQFVAEKLIMLAGIVKGVGAAAGTVLGDKGSLKQGAKTGINLIKAAFGSKTAVGELAFGNMSDAIAGKQKNDPVAEFMAELEAAQKNIEALRAGAPTEPGGMDFSRLAGRSARPGRPEVDSLARVGLFTASGLNAGPIIDIQRRMERHLSKIEKNTRETDTDPFS